MDTNRQPKGTSTGGQFAPSVNPESTIDLADIGDLEANDSVMGLVVKTDLEKIQDIADASDGRIVMINVGNGWSPAKGRREPVWDVEINELDGFKHVFVEGSDEAAAVRKVISIENCGPEDIVEITKTDKTMGQIRHRELWPEGETLRKERGHEFVTSGMLETIPDVYGQEDNPMADKMVYAHFFSSNGDWYITEMDKEEGLAFGHCDLGMGYPEFGYVSLKELEETRGRFGVAVERDLHFEPKTVGELGLVS